MYIDSHAHVYKDEYKDKTEEIINRSKEAGVGIVNVGTNLQTSTAVVEMLDKYPELYASVGLHPDHTYRTDDPALKIEPEFNYNSYEALARNDRVVAIGECGLDYFRLDENPEELKSKQAQAFLEQIRLAKTLNKAVVIHCRPSANSLDAYQDLISILDSWKDSQLRFVVHCFTGPLAIAEKLVAMGGFLGINGIITFDKTGNLEAVVRTVPLENLVLETDCPYLTPAPYRGEVNEPKNVELVAKKIAEYKGLSLEEVAAQTTENTKKLFNI